jgi:PhoPQ-activated pathogenicity-related protein
MNGLIQNRCRRIFPLLAVVGLSAQARGGEPLPTALFDYVAKPQPDFKWSVKSSIETKDGKIHEVHLTSQKWQDIVWKHNLYLYEPTNLATPNHALLFITSGRIDAPPKVNHAMGMQLAKTAGSVVAMLFQVPNQPLMGDKVEDDLITETFLKYLETRDPNWPLLFPMVNSAIKAMDAVQQIAEKEWKRPIKTFVVTGASKRGWTTWLTSASDPRVVGLAPMVIDTLNFQPQMKHQIECWGVYSEQIEDYTKKGLVEVMQNQPEIPLWRWVDPYTYREKITQPKLIVNGANDRYWTLDALNYYWDDLKGPKSIHYVPNGGHGLEGGREQALATVAVFSRLTAQGKSLPKMDWNFTKTPTGYRLDVKSDAKPQQALMWSTTSATKDFRTSKWVSSPMTPTNEGFAGAVLRPGAGHYALHGAMTFEIDKTPILLSTQMKWE